MSRISRIKLTNYCQHKDLEISLKGNLIGVIGDNASGKTNLISSVASAITGTFPKKKSGMISHGETKGSVEVEFQTSDSRTVVISRDLHGSGCSLSATDPTGEPTDWSPLTTTESVNAMMGEIFPYPATVLKGVIFTPQESITSLLFDPKSSIRERMAMSFFGIEKAEEVESGVAEVLSGIEIKSPPSDYIPSKEIQKEILPRKRKELEEKESLSADLEEQISKLENKILKYRDKKVNPAKEWMDHAEVSNQESSLSGAISSLQEEINEINDSISEKVESLDGLNSKDLYDQLKCAEALLDAQEAHTAALDEVNALRDRNEDSGLRAKKRDIQGKIEEVRERLERESNSLARQEGSIQSKTLLIEGGEGEECATCLRSGLTKRDLDKISEELDLAPEKIKELKRKIKDIKLEEQELNSDLTSLRSEESRNKRDLEVSELRYKEAKDSLESAKEASSKWDQIPVKRLRRALEAARDMESEMLKEEKLLERKSERLLSLKEDLKKMRGKDAPENPLGLSSISDAMEILDAFDKMKQELGEIRPQLSQAKYEAKEMRKEVDSLEKKEKSFRKFEKDREEAESSRRLISAVRAVFHYSAAPKKVVSARLKAVSKRINAYLEAFESEFLVDARDGFDFDCVFGGRVLGKVMTPQDLSGGEKVALSVAFRLAASETFCSKTGFLVLDEPTVWMDKRRIENIPRVMEKLSRLSEESGFQYIVVTHDTRLMRCFDQTIELAPQQYR